MSETARRISTAGLPSSEGASPERRFGALPERGGVRFRVFASRSRQLRLQVLTGAARGVYQMQEMREGLLECLVAGAAAGDRYAYSIHGSDPRPDPASRFQPDGVHAPSEVVEPEAYRWVHHRWRGRSPADLAVYELHIGAFTRAGTFAAARERLADLRDLGVTAVEVMPIAEFAGTRNWGYDGVCLYAPSHNYGRPDDFRAFVDAAHGLGLAVILDVVYNHLGPEGAYLPQFYPAYITDRHETPWGGAINLDGEGSDAVRGFIIDNALHWVREYRLDGLRLDATHALVDDSPVHVVAELAAAVRAAVPRPVVIHAEDHRNLSMLVEPATDGGWGLDGLWADDFHHVVRRHLAGDAYSYFQDFEGGAGELARTIRQGWLFTGQPARSTREARGSDPSHIPMHRFVVCLQNHDQIGNRATGDRLHHAIDAAAWRAASTLLLTAPMTPLLFMGQEWAASTPFQYFTDLEPGLGGLVTEGRRREFKDFPEFSDAAARQRIPDPQSPDTLEASRLRWQERGEGVHRVTLALYKELLRLRSAHAALAASSAEAGDAAAIGEDAVVVRRADGLDEFQVAVCLSGQCAITFAGADGTTPAPAIVLTTEDARFALDPVPIVLAVDGARLTLRFQRPGAAILRLPLTFAPLADSEEGA